MTDVVLVRPRHGLILDGIPSKGAEVPRALAEEWIADRLVEEVSAGAGAGEIVRAGDRGQRPKEPPRVAEPIVAPTPKRRSTK
jgi:hypothetical protein